MDGFNTHQDFSMCRMALQNILQTRDLSHPIQVNSSDKDDKDFSEVCPDASAAFLGPNLWNEYKTAFIDIDSFLGNSPENGQPIIENLDKKIPEIPQQIQDYQVPHEKPSNAYLQGYPRMYYHYPQQYMCPGSHESNASSVDSAAKKSFTELDNNGGRGAYAVDCKFSPTDLALATPPGQKHYDPASACIPDDELKPQPIIKKSRKNYVPDNLKDDKYWARRLKNNIAAKRSREARRFKENQIVLRASYLEKENNTLKEDVIRLQAENSMLKEKIRKFET